MSMVNLTYDCVECPKCKSSQFLIYTYPKIFVVILCHWCVCEIRIYLSGEIKKTKKDDFRILKCNKCGAEKFQVSDSKGSITAKCKRCKNEIRIIKREDEDIPELQGCD